MLLASDLGKTNLEWATADCDQEVRGYKCCKGVEEEKFDVVCGLSGVCDVDVDVEVFALLR